MLSCPIVHAYESDVHFGLTQWLALQAGFAPPQAQAIAIGDNRVDSGDMQYLNPVFIYGCVGGDDDTAKAVSQHHYPTSGAIPGAPEQRNVVSGSDAAYRAVRQVMKAPVTQSGLRLYLLGEALHILQDSWSHQGAPEVPQIGDAAFGCDPSRAWSHARARGGWNSHKADQTMSWPSDTVTMAKATYDVLTSYPPIMEAQRSPKSWEQIRPELDGFGKAATKTEKKAWFSAHGITDVAFLGDTTLKDGKERFDVHWSERKLPALTTIQSRQHDVSADLLDFYSRFFGDWMSSDDFDRVAATYGVAPAKSARAGSFVPMDQRELAARLKLWRLRDHGTAADLAHVPGRLTPKQLASVATLGKRSDIYVRYKAPTDAFFPMLPIGNDPSPLLPFIVSEANSGANSSRAVATAKFRHAPYDVVAVVADKIDGQWRVVSIEAAVDH